MVISKKYRLNITDNVSKNMQFLMDTPLEVKNFMKKYLSNSSMIAQVYLVTTTWDLATGSITQTSTQITEDF